MTGPRMRHPEFEELISASLTGELSDEERRRLDAHLDGCVACRGALADFADGRRIVGGLRHLPPPRDLHARVRTGIERGRFAPLPWWRRPAVLFAGLGGSLAAVAGALLAIVLFNQPSAPVGEATPTMTPSVAASASPSLDPFPTGPTPTPPSPAPSATPTEPASTATPEPSATPSPEPDVYLAMTGPLDNRALIVQDGATGETIQEIGDTPSEAPIAAELSPDGQWIAYITPMGESGMHEVRATRIAEGVPGDDPDAMPPIDSPIEVGQTIVLGQSGSGDLFVERLFWSSPRGAHLAFTLTDPESGSTDVWLFEPENEAVRQLTDVGSAYAASWATPDDQAPALLWISVAGSPPTSYLYGFPFDAGPEPVDDLAETALATGEGVFQPILNPSGRFAIFWDGSMERGGDGAWQFTGGGQPYLAEHDAEGESLGFTDRQRVFRDLTVGRDGFASASITWGEDGDAYAVWDARWTGSVQSGEDEDPYPDPARVYFGRALDERGLTRLHAIDRDDIPEGWQVVDVKVAPTGEHLVVTVAQPRGGVLEATTAELLLIERNTGSEPDDVRTLAAEEGFWFGPGAFDRVTDGD